MIRWRTNRPVLPNQVASLEFGDFRRAFWQLADDRREALILIGASGLSYEEAAKVCDCPKGTIKSRVSRARRELLQILEDGLLADRRRDFAGDGRLRRGPAGSAGARQHQVRGPSMAGALRNPFLEVMA